MPASKPRRPPRSWLRPLAALVAACAALGCTASDRKPTPPPAALDLGPVTLALVQPPGLALAVGATEVTNRQFRAFRAEHSSNRFHRPHYIAAALDLDGDRQPAVVTWSEAVAFCRWASTKTGLTVRLPTADEWTRLARAGTTTTWSWGDDPHLSPRYANLAGPATHRLLIAGDPAYPQDDLAGPDPYVGTAPVGRFEPNPWRLYDMHGNVAEWVADPAPEGGAGARLHRGGSWTHGPRLATSDGRNYCFEDQHYDVLGFRIVVEPAPGG